MEKIIKNIIKKILVVIFELLLKIISLFVKKSDEILCFDCLYDQNQEQIDTYSFFEYLQKQNINSKYIALLDTSVALNANNDNIIKVKNKWEFVFKYLFLIAKSKCICTSFGLFDGLDEVLKKNYDKYILLEHGVVFYNSYIGEIYNGSKFNKVIVPTNLTKKLYKQNDTWQDEQMIFCGLPRWDKLICEEKTKSIFIFFTWRVSFKNFPKSAKKYVDFVIEFLNSLSNGLSDDIKIYFSYHHELKRCGVEFMGINPRVQFVSSDKISEAIKKSSLFITDYSSIFWDFLYQRKPVIFYRFDFDEKYPNDVDNSTILEIKNMDNLFFNCFSSKNEVLNKIDEYAKNDFALEKDYYELVKNYFYSHENNCFELLKKID